MTETGWNLDADVPADLLAWRLYLLARSVLAEHPEWPREQIKAEVKSRLREVKGEVLLPAHDGTAR